MKWKYYLRGFGVGVIFTAVILAILNSSGKNLMSNQEIMEQAKELGMVDPNESNITILETAVPTDKTTPVPTKEVKEVVVTVTPNVKETSKTEKQEKETTETNKNQKPAEKEEVVKITVESGMWSEKICQKLQELGVVDDAKSLDEYLCENGYASNIRPGIYKVYKGASYEEIAQALTK